ncbi:MAG: hypothetical protein B0D92_00240 [Spirochaeta sp. LUC14_002_19_P3]|nr:MAG: hypothetical protein B0D92_00240 [Spirochaeta sp. LUC14_002_19_P3]
MLQFSPVKKIVFVFLLISCAVGIISAQSGENSLPGLGGFGSSFKQAIPRPQTSARIAAWNPQSQSGLIAVHYIFPNDYHHTDSDYLTLVPEAVQGVIYGSVLRAEPDIIDDVGHYYDDTTLLLEFRSSTAQPLTLLVTAYFQICEENGVCLLPDMDTHRIAFNPASMEAVEADEEVLSILDWNSRGLEAMQMPDGSAQLKPLALLLFLLMAFAGGVLLNLMPCILPLLSVKALGLVKQAGARRAAVLAHAWLYAAGILVSMWALAAVVIALQASGTRLGWGFQFQSPGFLLALIAVIWVFGLSMFGVFVIEAPRKSMEGAAAVSGRGGYAGSFFTGIFAVFVATPCTAPLLGPALGFAFSQSPAIILAMFSTVGLGLALPFVLLGVLPGIKLPKPGAWMNTFKEAMAFLLMATTLYLYTTYMTLAPHRAPGLLWWLLALGFSAWLLGKARSPASKRWFRISGQAAAVILAAGSGFIFATPKAEQVDFIAFEEKDVERRIATGETVFLEFTADWCTTCKVNQRVLKSSTIRNLIASNNIVHIKADLTAYDETLTRWLARFGRAGVPLYVLFRPGEEPYIFPELITVNMLVEKFE